MSFTELIVSNGIDLDAMSNFLSDLLGNVIHFAEDSSCITTWPPPPDLMP